MSLAAQRLLGRCTIAGAARRLLYGSPGSLSPTAVTREMATTPETAGQDVIDLNVFVDTTTGPATAQQVKVATEIRQRCEQDGFFMASMDRLVTANDVRLCFNRCLFVCVCVFSASPPFSSLLFLWTCVGQSRGFRIDVFIASSLVFSRLNVALLQGVEQIRRAYATSEQFHSLPFDVKKESCYFRNSTIDRGWIPLTEVCIRP